MLIGHEISIWMPRYQVPPNHLAFHRFPILQVTESWERGCVLKRSHWRVLSL